MTKLAFLPFLEEFGPAIRSGKKTATARPKLYGLPGHILATRFGLIEIRKVSRLRLSQVRDFYWRDEGVESPEEFERIWARLHPRKGFVPTQVVYLHRFVYVGSRAKADAERRKAAIS